MQQRNSSSTLRWFTQAGLGILLIVLLGVHLIVNHWVVPQGLLSYADVIHYYDVPGIALMETLFLAIVTVHCLMGIHSVLLDLALSPRTIKVLTWALIVVGLGMIIYGIRLTLAVRRL